METRTLGAIGEVSALTLGGGGIGAVWGETSRAEAVATVREAVDAGITLLDLAPSYGAGEAERVIGDAFAGALPDGVRLTTKYGLGDPPAGEVYDRLSASLSGSLARMRVDHVDVFLLHSSIVANGAGSERGTPLTAAPRRGPPSPPEDRRRGPRAGMGHHRHRLAERRAQRARRRSGSGRSPVHRQPPRFDWQAASR